MEVAAAAGRVLKKTVLELGGSDPFIVLADVDPAEAGKQAAKARTINSGQSCIAAKRFIVEEAVAERFEAEFVQAMAALKVGDPLDRGTEIGPIQHVGDARQNYTQFYSVFRQAGGKTARLGSQLLTAPPNVGHVITRYFPVFSVSLKTG